MLALSPPLNSQVAPTDSEIAGYSGLLAAAANYLPGFLLERLNPQMDDVHVVTPTKPVRQPCPKRA
jgi:hypothetical protein